MHTDLKSRRDEWLKLSHQEYESIQNLYGTYLLTQISKYAQYSFAKFREKELKPKAERQLPKWLKYSIYTALTILGVTVFTVLPSIITEETGASDSVTQIGKSIGGVLLVFLGHWSVSLLLEQILLYIQYQTVLKQLTIKLDSSTIILQQRFSEAQIDYLKDSESPFASYPSIFYISFAVLASLLEVGGLIFIFTRDENSSINYFLIFIISIVPVFLLWTISFITAYYEKVPQTNIDIVEIHYKKIMETNQEYEKEYLSDTYIEDVGDSYLSKMEGLLFDIIERDESIINYLLNRLRLEDKRKNEVIMTEGELEYYKSLKIKLQNEDSNRRRDTTKLNDIQIQNQESNYEDVEPNGEGGLPFHLNQEIAKKNEFRKAQIENDNKRANEIIGQCSERIDALMSKLTDIQD